MPLSLTAHAKINWYLFVLGRRADGYHTIESLMQAVSLHDTLTFDPADELEVLCDSSDVPRSEGNLVHRAARKLQDHTDTRMGARIVLTKRIPVAAGLGGGSSDAAATLSGLNELWGLCLGMDELRGIGAALGSDVPFFLGAGAALVEGRGEIVNETSIKARVHILLLKPALGVSAGWAYGAIKRYTSSRIDKAGFVEALRNGDGDGLRALGRNDLEFPVFEAHPEVSALKTALLAHGAIYALMSGSGSTVFGVFLDQAAAQAAASAIPSHFSALAEPIG